MALGALPTGCRTVWCVTTAFPSSVHMQSEQCACGACGWGQSSHRGTGMSRFERQWLLTTRAKGHHRCRHKGVIPACLLTEASKTERVARSFLSGARRRGDCAFLLFSIHTVHDYHAGTIDNAPYSLTLDTIATPMPMRYEVVPTSRIFDEIEAALPEGAFQNAKTVAAVEGIYRQEADPDACGDVATQLTRPRHGCPSNSNHWVHAQADVMMLRMMQIMLDETHADSENGALAICKDCLEVGSDDPSRRHLVFKVYVIRRLQPDRSLLRRALYHAMLFYLFHRGEGDVDIVISFPDEEKPQPNEAEGHRYFSYKRKRLVEPSARATNTDEDEVPAPRPDNSLVKTERGCLFVSTLIALRFYFVTLQVIKASDVASFANLLRGLFRNRSFE